jgi:RNA ligase
VSALAGVLDMDNLSRHVAAGLIACKHDPRGLRLYNYTAKAQYTKTWDRETLTCRGLVVSDTDEVMSRPFPKFFNLYEHESPDLPDLPVEPFTVHEKVDGSLIIVSTDRTGEPIVTTRGSFDSKQALEARHMLDTLPPPGQTWLLELIAPWNRIVVDYGDRTDLVFLAAIDNVTGHDVDVEWGGPRATTYDGLDDFDVITERLAGLGPNDEGYVLRFASGMRAKAKGVEYARLHKLLTGVTARTIHECLSTGTGIGDLLDRVPDEFYGWVKRTADDLAHRYRQVELDAHANFVDVSGMPTRKDQAIAVKNHPHKGVVFSMLDGKDYSRAIWRTLRPDADVPTFTTEEAAS